jgi:hypothetical protein
MHPLRLGRPRIVTLVAKRLYETDRGGDSMAMQTWEALGEAFVWRYVQQARLLVAFVGELETDELSAFDRQFERRLEALYALPSRER